MKYVKIYTWRRMYKWKLCGSMCELWRRMRITMRNVMYSRLQSELQWMRYELRIGLRRFVYWWMWRMHRKLRMVMLGLM